MLTLHVFGQAALQSKALSTVLTLKWLHTGMHQHVSFHVTLTPELFLTLLTLDILELVWLMLDQVLIKS